MTLSFSCLPGFLRRQRLFIWCSSAVRQPPAYTACHRTLAQCLSVGRNATRGSQRLFLCLLPALHAKGIKAWLGWLAHCPCWLPPHLDKLAQSAGWPTEHHAVFRAALPTPGLGRGPEHCSLLVMDSGPQASCAPCRAAFLAWHLHSRPPPGALAEALSPPRPTTSPQLVLPSLPTPNPWEGRALVGAPQQ